MGGMARCRGTGEPAHYRADHRPHGEERAAAIGSPPARRCPGNLAANTNPAKITAMSELPLVPLGPSLVGDQFTRLGAALVELLAGLAPADWTRPTVAGHWRVRDVAAHLLDVSLRRLASGRDGHFAPPPTPPIRSAGDLVTFLDQLNASFVAVSERLSPRLLVELHAAVQPAVARHLAAVDPFAPALFPVAWAGEAESLAWFDVARELTEHWHHQQQIRLAVGAPVLDDPALSAAVLATFLRALPNRYAAIATPVGSTLQLTIQGRVRHRWVLLRGGDGWALCNGDITHPTATITTDETSAWLGFTKGLTPESARARAEVTGDERLIAPFFSTLAIMAHR